MNLTVWKAGEKLSSKTKIPLNYRKLKAGKQNINVIYISIYRSTDVFMSEHSSFLYNKL